MKKGSMYLLLAIACVACQGTVEAPEEGLVVSDFPPFDSLEMASHGVLVGSASVQPYSEEIACTGRVEIPPQSRADMVAVVGGYVRAIYPYEGERVRKGQILVQLEHPDFIQWQTDYLEASAEVERASAALERLQNLANEAAASQKEVDRARADFSTWNVRMASAKARLAQLGVGAEELKVTGLKTSWSLKAPFDGYVHDVAANLGSYAAPTDVLLRVENPQHSHIELAVFGKEAEEVMPGQTFEFALNGSPTRQRGSVKEVGKAPSANGSYTVHGHPNAEVHELRSGAFVQAWIQRASSMHPTLPSEAVLEWEGQTVVLQVVGAKIQPVPVKVLGEKEGMKAFEALPEGRFVVARANVLLPVGEAE